MKTRVQIRADFKCEHPDCDYTLDENNHLNVHHTYYEKGKKPWEYPIDSLQCLCERHHEEVHSQDSEDEWEDSEDEWEDSEDEWEDSEISTPEWSSGLHPHLVDKIKKVERYGLKELTLCGDGLPDLTPLQALTSLELLNLGASRVQSYLFAVNRIVDLTPLQNLTELKWLYLNDLGITDLSPLAKLTKLEGLILEMNKISDLTPLKGLAKLKGLDLGQTQLTDLTLLKGFKGLENLVLPGNFIADLTPITGLTTLKFLNLKSNRIRDLTPLKDLTNLKRLSLQNNPISEEQKTMIKKTHPEAYIYFD
jgi:hypothetical protein